MKKKAFKIYIYTMTKPKFEQRKPKFEQKKPKPLKQNTTNKPKSEQRKRLKPLKTIL